MCISVTLIHSSTLGFTPSNVCGSGNLNVGFFVSFQFLCGMSSPSDPSSLKSSGGSDLLLLLLLLLSGGGGDPPESPSGLSPLLSVLPLLGSSGSSGFL